MSGSSGSLRLILGDQLTAGISSLADLDPARDVVLMVEVASETISWECVDLDVK